MSANTAKVIAQRLVDAGVGFKPPLQSGQTVGVTSPTMPDEDEADAWVSVTNDGFTPQGTLMKSGTRVRRPKVVINVRNTTDDACLALALAVQAALDAVSFNTAVVVDGITWNLWTVFTTLAPTFVGREPKKRRYLYSLNATVTYVP